MRLVEALRLAGPGAVDANPARLALVGAGGKTTAMFRLGGELLDTASGGRVFLSATTHLAAEQGELAGRHVLLDSPASSLPPAEELKGVILFSGPGREGRLDGLDPESLQKVLDLAQDLQAPFLLEADGSRRKPLKAPAGHEPVIPGWVRAVVVTAGLQGLNRPLSEALVHRPERFAALSGLAEGEPVTVEALAKVLLDPLGGLKGIPVGARRIVLLNAGRNPVKLAQAKRLGNILLEGYEAVLTAALHEPGSPVYSVQEAAAGVVLAAGGAVRFGRPKQLLDWEGEPFVRRVAREALAAGLSPVVVVVGAASGEVSAALEGLPLTVQRNEGWESGQASSISTGVRSLPGRTGSAVFLLADQPQIGAQLIRSLVDLHQQTLASIAAPMAGGRRGNPVLFDRVTFPDLLALTGDRGGRALFSRHPVTYLPWHDESILLDVDTAEDYQKLRERVRP
jgi:molybdenum cofactor cytidylyltransferase